MDFSARLDALREELPGCRLVAFGDVSTGLALRTSASRRYRQEYLDEVLQQAKQNFGLSDTVTDKNNLVVIATPDEFRIFVRMGAQNPDVICCVCEFNTEVGRVVRSAQRLLSELSRAA